MSLIMSYITIDCDLFLFITHSNHTSKAGYRTAMVMEPRILRTERGAVAHST